MPGRLVGVALDLAQRHRRVGDPAVGEPDGVAGVLPALVGQAPAAAGVDVLQQAVAVGVPVVAHVAQGGGQVRQQRPDLRLGHAPAPGVVQQADPQRGGVDGAVVPGGQSPGPLPPGRAQLVQDLARRLAGGRVDPAALAPGQRAQRARGQRPAEGQQQPGGPDAVPAEQGQVPGRARRPGTPRPGRGRWPAAARPRRAGPERAGGPGAGRRRRRARRATGRRPRRAARRRRRPGRRRPAPRPPRAGRGGPARPAS